MASAIAYKIMKATGKNIETMGLDDKSAGFSKETDNLPPNFKKIINRVKKICK